MSRSSDTTVPCNPLKPGNLVRPHSNDERGSGTDSADLSLQVIILRCLQFPLWRQGPTSPSAYNASDRTMGFCLGHLGPITQVL